MKKHICVFLTLVLSLSLSACQPDSLPLPELDSGMRGELGIDKNINESTIDKYLNREDSVYRDMRMLKDEADYAAIGGDSYLSGYVKGFEVVPYPYLCNVEGLPEAVGEPYKGETLFTHSEEGYTANYRESMHILESLFPKDKYIFLMCGGGGYAGMTKQLLVALGWDGDKIYNTGGYWYYQGKNGVTTSYEEDGEVYYDFSGVDYHDIDFTLLTPVSGSSSDQKKTSVEDDFIVLQNADELKQLEEEKKTFALYVYLPGCASCASFYPIVKEFSETQQIDIYAVDLTVLFHDENSVSQRITYTPSMFIYQDGEVLAFLDPQSDEDLPIYRSLEALTTWFSEYADIEVFRSDSVSEISDCENACSLSE